MNIYFFSYHVIDPNTIKNLGTTITTKFNGEISEIHSNNLNK